MTILIVEDEPKTARLLRELILEAAPGKEPAPSREPAPGKEPAISKEPAPGKEPAISKEPAPGREVLAICDSIHSTVRWLKASPTPPGLIFMDIHLADGISFDIFKQIQVRSPVVFCTAYEDYTLQAFKAGGIAYILKPFREEDIAAVFARIEQIKHIDVPGALTATFLVRNRDKMYPVAARDIALVALENEVTYLYTFDQAKHPLFKGMEEVEAALDPTAFFRINRQMIISREAVREIAPLANRKVRVHTCVHPADAAVVSRLKVTDFLHWLEWSKERPVNPAP